MANDLHTSAVATPHPGAESATTEPGLATTFKGVVDDALELMKQQFIMLKAEVRSDFRKVLAGIIPLAVGVVPLVLGGLMLCFALVHLIHWASFPTGTTADAAHIPLWASYAIVSALFLLVGGVLLGLGIYRLKTVNPLPEQTAQALEENLQWLMNKNPK
jgi:hypothetical protein